MQEREAASAHFAFVGPDDDPYDLSVLGELVEYLRIEKPPLGAIAKYLVEKTLCQFEVSNIFFSAIRLNGAVYYPAGYGYNPQYFSNDPERLVSTDTPANETLRTGKIMACGSYDEYLFSNPTNAEFLFPRGFASAISWPIPDFGAAIVTSDIELAVTPNLEYFFERMGSLLALYLMLNEKAKPTKEITPSNQPEQLLTLTKRQWAILEDIRKGATNLAIARKFGFSESTIRHETMRIYEKLNVRGRVDLLDSRMSPPIAHPTDNPSTVGS